MDYYYRNKDGNIELTLEGQYVLSYFGLTLEDIRNMSPEQLTKHCKSFGDSLNDGKIYKTGDVKPHKTTYENSGKTKLSFPRNATHITVSSKGDSGSYSRYFDLDSWYNSQVQFIITPKASASERNKGLENTPLKIGGGMEATECQSMLTGNGKVRNNLRHNHHPTVKPLKLMSYLITMGSRENDIILDPFCGSGTTLIAATQLNRKFIGIELNKEYCDIARTRLKPYQAQTKLV